MAGDVGGRSCPDSDLLLHPELLSQEFLLLTLEQKNINVENNIKENKDDLTDLYVQYAIPLPQRDLPKNRWGKMMEKKREQHDIKHQTKSTAIVEGFRKRPLIVFDGSSTSTSIKVKKTENGDHDRLKPPSQASFTSNALRKVSDSSASVSPLILSSNVPMNNKIEHSNNDTKQNHDLTHGKSPLDPAKSPPLSPVGTTPVKLKRAAPKDEAEAVNNLKPPEAKRKIQHVTWP
ncbi:PREDICTED: ashwin isoform X1 [Chrysochloris asiatica]|uniref:Ashwin n=1 Tax=Chrysochloris asiatica TaxID=185453 RepID=A0A9B0TXC4_CHRAS|nr:PREDICTED: ashwin isoform X1 [Chrysochloris asiatica]